MNSSIYQQFSETELELLKARAERGARQVQDDKQENLLTVLSVKVGEEKYALPIEVIANVYEGLTVTRVPCVPVGVAGIVNIRGRVYLVLDLKTLLNVPGEVNDSNVLVALADDELELALRVDKIEDVETIPASALSPTPGNIGLQSAGHIRGLFPNGLALLDFDSIVSDPSFAAVSSGT